MRTPVYGAALIIAAMIGATLVWQSGWPGWLRTALMVLALVVAIAGWLMTFRDLTPPEILGLAISLEEEDARILGEFARRLRADFPKAAADVDGMRQEEEGHRRRLIEMFLVVSWREHLNQHRRIDDVSAALIRRARAFDRTGEPRSRRLIAVDVERPPDFDLLLTTHTHMHETDGSILLEETVEFDAIRGDHI